MFWQVCDITVFLELSPLNDKSLRPLCISVQTCGENLNQRYLQCTLALFSSQTSSVLGLFPHLRILVPSFHIELYILGLANDNKINKQPSLNHFYLLG